MEGPKGGLALFFKTRLDAGHINLRPCMGEDSALFVVLRPVTAYEYSPVLSPDTSDYICLLSVRHCLLFCCYACVAMLVCCLCIVSSSPLVSALVSQVVSDRGRMPSAVV